MKSQKYILKLKTKKWLLVFGVVVIFSLFFIFVSGGKNITVTEKNSRNRNSLLYGEKSSHSSPTDSRDSQFSGDLDPTSQIFLDKKPKNSENGKNIIRYVNDANDAIALTPDALRFALQELILGNYEPLKDAQLRLEEGMLAIEKIAPPTDALVFHQMSLKLLREYSKILLVPLNTPRADFKPEQYGNSFPRLTLLVGLAKRELRFLQNTYSVSLFPKSILFYDEAIWIK